MKSSHHRNLSLLARGGLFGLLRDIAFSRSLLFFPACRMGCLFDGQAFCLSMGLKFQVFTAFVSSLLFDKREKAKDLDKCNQAMRKCGTIFCRSFTL